MGYSVDDFTSRIAKHGLASPNKFRIEFNKLPVSDPDRLLNFMAESVDIAGRQIQSTMNLTYGLRREIAYGAPTYNPLNVSFLCTGEMKEKKMLDKWNNLCVDASTGFDVAYYNQYIGTMIVYTLDKDGRTETYKQTFEEVWPKSVQSINLNHSTQNNTARVTVEFTYAYWTTAQTHTTSAGATNHQTANPHTR
tara:strand:+ start:479 stop:1060 length:582 start_codon:yes stop_codon:yes gene_type:complete